MIALAIVILAVGAIGVIGSTIMEIRHREPMWAWGMKISSLLVGVGGVILGIVIAIGG